jgi:hypothetical protein
VITKPVPKPTDMEVWVEWRTTRSLMIHGPAFSEVSVT